MYRSKIFIIGENQDRLIALEEASYPTEDVLQQLLARYPDLVPGDQIDPENPRHWLLVAREIGIPGEEDGSGRWSLDHLFLDQDGIPTFVECKRASDTRARREVVAQMLDYAANGIEYWSTDKLRQAAAETAQSRGSSLDADIASMLGEGDDETDVEGYWESVEANLQSRRVRLVFVSDSTPKELRRLVEFLNEEMANVEVLAVEIKQFRREGEQHQRALVPRVVGLTEAARSSKEGLSGGMRRVRHWDELSFFDDVAARVEKHVAEGIRQLYEHARRTDAHISWGTGKNVGTFNPKYEAISQRSVISVFSDGALQFNFLWLDDNEETIAYRRRLKEALSESAKLAFSSDYEKRQVRFRAEDWVDRVADIIEALDIALESIQQARSGQA